MGGNPYRFLLLYINFEIILLLVLNLCISRHDLLELARLAFDQFSHF